jgi:hypothetical protein
MLRDIVCTFMNYAGHFLKTVCGVCSSMTFLCTAFSFFTDNEKYLDLNYQSESSKFSSCDCIVHSSSWYHVGKMKPEIYRDETKTCH